MSRSRMPATSQACSPAAARRSSIVDAGVDDLLAIEAAAPDLLIVLGGPIGVYDTDRYPFLADEIRLIEQRLVSGRPMLGICLGAQLIARAAGCRVYPGPEKEIGFRAGRTDGGWHGVAPWRRSRASQFNVLHWHGDTFDLPAGATRLASTEITQNQAFSLGADVLALQFHIETEPAKFERWLIANAVEIAAAGLDVRELAPPECTARTVRRGGGARGLQGMARRDPAAPCCMTNGLLP